jgi:hypothetical protein
MTKNLTETNRDYAVFLPSISGFYQNYISNEINGKPMEDKRVPDGFEKGVIGCNFLEEDAYYSYKWGLYSAGHAQLDTAKSDVEEAMVQQRDRSKSFILGDSGGFQIAKGIIKFDWENFYEKPGQPNYVGKADKLRQDIQNWLEHTADYSMILDIPTWAARPPLNKRTGLNSLQECLDATLYNNDWFLKNRQGKTKYLNVLQGSDTNEADIWYDAVKHFPFEGWAMGGNNMQDIKLFLRRMINMRDEQLLEKGERDLIHVLGTSKLEWACMLTAIKRKMQQHVNSNLEITFDCASPFLATAYGQVYTQHVHRSDRFSYIMDKAVDDKRLANSNIPFPWASPIGERLTMGDLCYYAPGDLNKLGKEGRTSWDSFSYFLMMAHNVYQHIESVQRANQLTDTAVMTHDVDLREWRKPAKANSKALEIDVWTPRNLIYFNHLMDELFETETPMQLIEDNTALLADLSKGRLRKSSNTVFSDLFEENIVISEAGSEQEFDEEEALDKLLHVEEV